MSRPNILIFNPDEMRVGALGHLGHPAASTPYLDRFAREDAVSFRQAYCQNPVCVPSRCSFLTGLYPHVRGHRTMAYLLREGEPTLFTRLREAGYYVWMNNRNDLMARQIPGLIDAQADEIHYAERSRRIPADAPGKEAYNQAMRTAYPYSHFIGVMGEELPQDRSDVEALIERIRRPLPDGEPLCMFLGLGNPHPPYMVEEEYYQRIDRSKLPERVRWNETEGKSRIMDLLHENYGLQAWTEEDWDELRQIYLAQCAKVDEWFGRIVRALKEEGLYDQTAIFVLSDHGDFAGDYDLPEKAQNTFEDCLTKVPLLIKPPKDCPVDPGVTNSLAELVDFYATVLDYAGVQSGQDHFGRSLRPVLEDREASVRSYVHCEGGRRPSEVHCDEYHSHGPEGTSPKSPYWVRMVAQLDPLAHEKGTMVFDGRYKYVQRLSGNDEFYDLVLDPSEKINRFEEYRESTVLQRLKEELLHWYQETSDIVPYDYDSR